MKQAVITYPDDFPQILNLSERDFATEKNDQLYLRQLLAGRQVAKSHPVEAGLVAHTQRVYSR